MESPIAILGAGCWGTALAVHLSRSGQNVRLWDGSDAHLRCLQADRCNARYLPGIVFPDALAVSSTLEEAVQDAKDILLVIPSHAFAEVLLKLKVSMRQDARIVWATKGLDTESGMPLSTVAERILGARAFAVLSGPSFAKEVAQDLPTAVTVASTDVSFAKDLVRRFNQRTFRVYTSDDLIGVQLGGAVKNVVAIAAGISDGLHYGSNAKSALITRGLAEIRRLGEAMGAKRETFMGLSGLGDLVLTCTDNQSRNRRFGLGMAAGKSIEEIQQEIGQVIEGVTTVHQVKKLAEQYEIEMPICEQIFAVLAHQTSPKEAVLALFARKTKSE